MACLRWHPATCFDASERLRSSNAVATCCKQRAMTKPRYPCSKPTGGGEAHNPAVPSCVFCVMLRDSQAADSVAPEMPESEAPRCTKLTKMRREHSVSLRTPALKSFIMFTTYRHPDAGQRDGSNPPLPFHGWSASRRHSTAQA